MRVLTAEEDNFCASVATNVDPANSRMF
jgi:hypothetical protein